MYARAGSSARPQANRRPRSAEGTQRPSPHAVWVRESPQIRPLTSGEPRSRTSRCGFGDLRIPRIAFCDRALTQSAIIGTARGPETSVHRPHRTTRPRAQHAIARRAVGAPGMRGCVVAETLNSPARSMPAMQVRSHVGARVRLTLYRRTRCPMLSDSTTCPNSSSGGSGATPPTRRRRSCDWTSGLASAGRGAQRTRLFVPSAPGLRMRKARSRTASRSCSPGSRMAARIIARVVEQPARVPAPEDIVGLSTFVTTMAHRTPDARADLAAADVEIAKLMAQRLLSDPEAIRRALKPQATDEEVAEIQRRVLNDLRENRIEFESTPSREVGFMLAAIQPVTEWLISRAAWHVLVAPPDRQFVLSDAPVAQYDPTPKVPDAGAGFESSPNSMTIFAIDPRFAVLIRPSGDRLFDWRTREVDKRTVDDINLLIYAQADEAIFGSQQAIITGVRRDAKQSPRRLGEYRRRRARIWVTEIGSEDRPGTGGVRRFTSVNRDGPATRDFYLDSATEREAERRAI